MSFSRNQRLGFHVAAKATAIRQQSDLLPGEDKNLRKEILSTVGDEWLNTKNVWLKGMSPSELIGTPEEYKVRDILRSVMVAALS